MGSTFNGNGSQRVYLPTCGSNSQTVIVERVDIIDLKLAQQPIPVNSQEQIISTTLKSLDDSKSSLKPIRFTAKTPNAAPTTIPKHHGISSLTEDEELQIIQKYVDYKNRQYQQNQQSQSSATINEATPSSNDSYTTTTISHHPSITTNNNDQTSSNQMRDYNLRPSTINQRNPILDTLSTAYTAMMQQSNNIDFSHSFQADETAAQYFTRSFSRQSMNLLTYSVNSVEMEPLEDDVPNINMLNIDDPNSNEPTDTLYIPTYINDEDMEDNNQGESPPYYYVQALKKRVERGPDNPTLTQAQKNDPSKWQAAIDLEMKTIKEMVPLRVVTADQVPAGAQILRSKMDLKTQYLPTGEVKKLKARLVVVGNLEKLDKLTYTNAPTTTEKSFKTILQIAVNEGWSIRGVDFTNAFLQADLKNQNMFCYQINSITKMVPQLYGNYNAPYMTSRRRRCTLPRRWQIA